MMENPAQIGPQGLGRCLGLVAVSSPGISDNIRSHGHVPHGVAVCDPRADLTPESQNAEQALGPVQTDLDSSVLKSVCRMIEYGLDFLFVQPFRTVLEHKQHTVPVLGTDEMGQDSHLTLSKINSSSQGFQRPPAREQGLGIAKQGEVGAFAGEWLP
jgi:hypothetical protein